LQRSVDAASAHATAKLLLKQKQNCRKNKTAGLAPGGLQKNIAGA
jgi:hypothetical protein